MTSAQAEKLKQAQQIALQLFAGGRIGEAKTAGEVVLASDADNAAVLHMLGLIAHQQHDLDGALSYLRKAQQAAPDDASIVCDLGGILHLQERLSEAEACFERALVLQPANGHAFYNLGCTLQAQGHAARAETCYRNALQILPGAVHILSNLGGCLQEQGRVDEAIACYRQALDANPDDISALNNLGVSLNINEFSIEAYACFSRVIVLQPDFIRAYTYLGLAYYAHADYEQALRLHKRALAIDNTYTEAHFSIGVVLQALCRPQEALEYYEQALQTNADHARARDNLLMALHFIPGLSQQQIFDAHVQYGRHVEKSLKPCWPRHTNGKDKERRLRIAYVSGDFRNHAVAYFIEPVFAHHDKAHFEIYCYSNSAQHDAFTERLIAHVDHWQNCVSMSDDQLAQRIREDGIDILIDLAGHTAHNRLLTFARKPAPVQITYLGYPGSSGLSAMDYRITDGRIEPVDDMCDRYYIETLLRVPESMWCYSPVPDMPDITPLPALHNGYVTFGSFNNVNKISDACIELWATLLRTIPTSRLMMVTVPDGEVRTRLTQQFQGLGIDPRRIQFQVRLPSYEFQLALQKVDITLDPFPVNGATTTCESLWMGVPVLALVGERFLARAGLSVLSAARLPDFAAKTPEELIGTATLLANNLPLLANIRAGLRDHLKFTPLLDQQGFTRNLESLYREAWTQWCERVE